MTEETQNYRKTLIATFLSRKGDKIQQKIQHKIDAGFKDWETILNDYISITTKLNNMVQLAEQHQQANKLLSLLKQCTSLIKASCDQFTSICDLIDVILPMSNLNMAWMESIVKQEARLGQMKDSLSHVLLFSCNRDVIEVVQKMMLQVTEIQQKINYATNKVHDAMHNAIKNSSDTLANIADAALPSFAANDDDESISMISANSVCAEVEI